MKKILIIIGAVCALLVLALVSLLAYRKHQSDLCYKETGPKGIAGCTRWIEKDGVEPFTRKSALRRRAALYAHQKDADLSLADTAMALKIELPDKAAQAGMDKSIQFIRLTTAFTAKRYDIVARSCDSYPVDARSAAGLLRHCALGYFLAGRFADAAADAWRYSGQGKAGQDFLMLAVMTSLFSGDTERALKGLGSVDLSAVPAGSRTNAAIMQSDMLIHLNEPRAGLAVLDALLKGGALGKNETAAVQLRRFVAMAALGLDAEGLRILDQLIPADTPEENAQMLRRRGNVLEALGRFDEALSAFRQAAAANPKLFSPHSGAGTALARKKLLPEAEAEFRTAMRMSEGKKDDPETLLGAAYCCFLLRRDRTTAANFMARALAADLKSLSHPKSFKWMLNALVKDPRLKAIAKSREANIRTIPARASHSMDIRGFAKGVMEQAAQNFDPKELGVPKQ